MEKPALFIGVDGKESKLNELKLMAREYYAQLEL
jgi:hypothetical protein